jgi:hypothetical protein
MKKILIALLFLTANFQTVFAGTSGINGEYIFYLIPLAILSFIWVGYEIKARIIAKRIARLEARMAAEGANDSPDSDGIESSEI